jgi:NAD(P)-dependent dehydrogenase (short-subunit alcohol dehydrogenase family)
MARKEKGAVVVTGASTGIGRATALHLDQRGYRVFAGVRKQSDANSLKKEATGDLTPVTLDVTKPRSIAAARQKVQRAVGKAGIEGLVNNAGVANAGPVEHLPVADFQRVIEVNLIGQYAVTQEFLPLIRRGDGTILFITSIGGRVASPFFSPYNAAKFGLEGMADSLRREIKPWSGIDVVVIEPGSIATPIWAKGRDNSAAAGEGMSPEARRLYGPQMERMREVTAEAEDRGLEPVAVAKVIEKAIRKRNPRSRYIVGRDAKMMARMQGLLGDKRFDKAMRKSMGLPDHAPKAR